MAYRTLALYESGGQGNLYNANPSVVSGPAQGGIRTMALYESGGRGTPYGGPPGNIPGGPGYGGPPGNIPPPVGNSNAGYSMPSVGGVMQRYATNVNAPGFTMPNWTPAALAPANPQTDRQIAREAKVNARKLARAAGGGGGRGYVPLNWTHTASTMPAGAGTGGYFPGTAGEAQNRVKQDAAASFQSYARTRGASPQQIQQGVAAIMAGGSPNMVGSAGYGGGGGGGIGRGGQELIRQFSEAQAKANAANESRYKDALTGRQELLNRSLQNLMGMGGQEASDINRDAKARQAAMRQSMVDRGLTNTTVLDTTGEVVNREKTDALGRLNERIRQSLIGLDTNLSKDIVDQMERKVEQAPSMNMLAQLAQLLGAAGPEGGSQLPPILQGGMGGAPIFANAGSLYGNPLAGMIAPMFGGALGARTNILNRRNPQPRRATPAPKSRGYSPLPAASMPRLPGDIPVYA